VRRDFDPAEWDKAWHEVRVALVAVPMFPPDRAYVGALAVIGVVVGVHEGLGLWTPLYAAALVAVGWAMAASLIYLARAMERASIDGDFDGSPSDRSDPEGPDRA